jgi:hypothetical protein
LGKELAKGSLCEVSEEAATVIKADNVTLQAELQRADDLEEEAGAQEMEQPQEDVSKGAVGERGDVGEKVRVSMGLPVVMPAHGGDVTAGAGREGIVPDDYG